MVILLRLHYAVVVVGMAAHLLLHLRLRRFAVHATTARHLHHVILMLLLLSGKLKLLR